jgi:membrane-associated protein
MIDVQHWLSTGGLILLAAMVFAESGLLVGFFLPGDSLLFIAGFLSSRAGSNALPSLPVTAAVVFVAATAGDQVGYLFGRRVGPSLFRRPQSRIFSPEHLGRAQSFFERRGAAAVVLARFVPVVRTFTPIVAGVSKMEYKAFVRWNVIGGTIWAFGVTLLGYFLGQVDVIEQNLEATIMLVVAVSVAPIGLELLKARKERRHSLVADVTHDLLDPGLADMVEEARHPDGQL